MEQNCGSWIDYFEDYSERPSIIIHADEPALLAMLNSIFDQLAQEEIAEAQLGNLPFTFSPRINSLKLCTVADPKEPLKTMFLLGKGQDRFGFVASTSFEWCENRDGWSNNRDLLLPVANSDVPCHQYFADKRNNDAGVIISFAEYERRNLTDIVLPFSRSLR